jgi:hypothetical protein
MMQRKNGMTVYDAIRVVTAFSLVLLWSVSAYAQEEGPGTVCILQLQASGEILATVVDDTQHINLAVLVPRDNVSNVPVRCQDIALDRLGAAVANQESFDIAVTARVLNNKGELQCTRGPFTLKINGGRGIAFKDCL